MKKQIQIFDMMFLGILKDDWQNNMRIGSKFSPKGLKTVIHPSLAPSLTKFAQISMNKLWHVG